MTRSQASDRTPNEATPRPRHGYRRPSGLAHSISLALILGVLLVVATTIGIGSVMFDDDSRQREGQVIERLSLLVMRLNRTPPHHRPVLLADLPVENAQATWSPEKPAVQLHKTFGLRAPERRLERALRRVGVRAVDLGKVVGQEERLGVVARLRDGTWLAASVEMDWNPLGFVLRGLLVLAIFACGIIVLAWWTSRRIIKPIEIFAVASEQFGADMDSPPLDERGPTEIAAAARAFNRMRERVRRNVQQRVEMLAAISHDLRTPITRLRLRADFIDDPDQRAKAEADLDEMQAMLDALLAFARDDRTDESRVAVDLAALVTSLCDDFADGGGAVTYDGPDKLVFTARPIALKRALSNLIGNALAYAGSAEVSLHPAPDRLDIVVADRGPGIPENQREAMFEPFRRLEPSRNRETGGTGLGLAIARTIIRGHGGEITLASRDGGGLIVRVTLPRLSGAG